MSDEIICPKCGSKKTRDSHVKETLNATGKITGKIVAIGLTPFTGFFGEALNRGISKGLGEIGAGVAGAFGHKRVCDKCGHCWFYE